MRAHKAKREPSPSDAPVFASEMRLAFMLSAMAAVLCVLFWRGAF
jgi:hypothetical protein